MKALLFILLFFILLVMIVGFGIIRTVFKLFFGSNQRTTSYRNQQKPTSSDQWHNTEKKKEKLFSKEEGEYVDFEEIKENDNEKK
ncbi:MAG: DUF4834 family protein [Bacteroidales bacterium]